MENWSIAYAGLGEVFVLLYFKWVAVLFLSYLLLTLSSDTMDHDAADKNNVDYVTASTTMTTSTIVSWKSLWLYATQVGLLATNIIVVNNLRDRHTDARATNVLAAF